MELSQYEDKCVHILTIDDVIFEGNCAWDSSEYCWHEYGREEEALRIDQWIFYKSDIKEVQVIEEKDKYLWMNKTEHRMHLDPEPFRMIESGEKTFELRLYDEKRREIREGDIIRFEDSTDEEEILKVLVKKLHVFKSFKELYDSLPLTRCGYTESDVANASCLDMEKYYSPEKERKYGVVGIEVEQI